MKKTLLFLTCALLTGACYREFDEVTHIPAINEKTAVLQGLADIELTITSNWAAATADLASTVTALRNNPTAASLAVAQTRWRLARVPWESNEGFGFGPVATDGIDGNSDDWPFDLTAFNQTLSSAQPLNEAYIIQMSTATRGFHAIEYLLFGQNGTKTAGDFTSRELQLLVLLAGDLNKQALALKTAWTPGSGSFATPFIASGKTGSAYATAGDALNEVLGAMNDILDELPNSKIQQALDKQDDRYNESRFSDNSLSDYQNNVKGVFAVYLGEYQSVKAEKSLSSLVQAISPAFDEKVKTQFELCIALLEAVPVGMSQAIYTQQDRLKAIQTELNTLRSFINSDSGSVKAIINL